MSNKDDEPIVNADTEEGQMAGEAIVEAIENQIEGGNPEEVGKTLDRLMKMGETRQNAIRYIATVFAVEMYEIMTNGKSFNEKRYVKNLKRLPTLPDNY